MLLAGDRWMRPALASWCWLALLQTSVLAFHHPIRCSLPQLRAGRASSRRLSLEQVSVPFIDSNSTTSPLTAKMKSLFIRQHVNNTDELVRMRHILFTPPFPQPFAIELYFRHLAESHPGIVCSVFFKSLHSTPTLPVSSLAIVRVLKSTANLLMKKESIPETAIHFPNYSNPILGIFDYAVEKQMTTIGIIVTSIIACKELRDFSGVFSIYNRAKQLAKDGRILEYEKRRLPDIVYGQTVIALAKLGAETQTYQLVCDMLEAGKRVFILFTLLSTHLMQAAPLLLRPSTTFFSSCQKLRVIESSSPSSPSYIGTKLLFQFLL